MQPGYSSVPTQMTDEKQHRYLLAQGVNGVMAGRQNVILPNDLTLNVSTTSTVINDARISVYSQLVFTALTADAAAALSFLYVPPALMTQGSATVMHASNSQSDRTFRVEIIG